MRVWRNTNTQQYSVVFTQVAAYKGNWWLTSLQSCTHKRNAFSWFFEFYPCCAWLSPSTRAFITWSTWFSPLAGPLSDITWWHRPPITTHTEGRPSSPFWVMYWSYYGNLLSLINETIKGFHNNLSSCTFMVSPVKQKNTNHRWFQRFIEFLRYDHIKNNYHSYSVRYFLTNFT